MRTALNMTEANKDNDTAAPSSASRLLHSRVGRELQRYDGDARLLACVVARRAGGDVLLISSSKRADAWVLPKGGWESDETLAECALREAEEEAGVRCLLWCFGAGKCIVAHRIDNALCLVRTGHRRAGARVGDARLHHQDGQALSPPRVSDGGAPRVRHVGGEHSEARVGTWWLDVIGGVTSSGVGCLTYVVPEACCVGLDRRRAGAFESTPGAARDAQADSRLRRFVSVQIYTAAFPCLRSLWCSGDSYRVPKSWCWATEASLEPSRHFRELYSTLSSAFHELLCYACRAVPLVCWWQRSDCFSWSSDFLYVEVRLARTSICFSALGGDVGVVGLDDS